MKVTLTPSREEGEAEPTEKILTLETDDDGDEGEKTGGEGKEEKVAQPELWQKYLVLTEQPDEYDSGDDPEYVPPPVILDTSFEYDEVSLLEIPFLLTRFSLSLSRKRKSFPTTRWRC